MTEQSTVEARVDRQDQRIDRMSEILATKENLKIIHDRLNILTIAMITGFGVTIASVVVARLLS